ncbi:MAG: hypothetical protein JWR61_5804 [Ferruginibacter sp.]|nr:hypothetical protein [Ferruginibacter sp.]
MTDSPSEELLRVLQEHRQKTLQPPPEPEWQDEQEDTPPAPSEGSTEPSGWT